MTSPSNSTFGMWAHIRLQEVVSACAHTRTYVKQRCKTIERIYIMRSQDRRYGKHVLFGYVCKRTIHLKNQVQKNQHVQLHQKPLSSKSLRKTPKKCRYWQLLMSLNRVVKLQTHSCPCKLNVCNAAQHSVRTLLEPSCTGGSRHRTFGPLSDKTHTEKSVKARPEPY